MDSASLSNKPVDLDILYYSIISNDLYWIQEGVYFFIHNNFRVL